MTQAAPIFDRVEQALGEQQFRILKDSTVAIIGLGSGGGFVAQALAMCGVGHFILIDPKDLGLHNVQRHVAGCSQVGQSKVEAVAKVIWEHNPQAQMLLRKGVFADNTAIMTGYQNGGQHVDMMAVCVDSENVKFQINDFCLQWGIPAVYAGVYERGIGGDAVFIHRASGGPCYACWAEQARDTSSPSNTPHEQLNYGQVEAGRLNAEPALWLDVVRVAAMQAKMVINYLTKGQEFGGPNMVLTANEPMELVSNEIVPAFTTEWLRVNQLTDCMVCGDVQPDNTPIDDIIAS